MLKYVFKRLLLIIPIIFCITLFIFTIINLSPGDPARIILGDAATDESVAQLRQELRLDDPFFQRFFRYIKDVLTGNFGMSYKTKTPVIQEITSRLPVTFRLALFGMLLSFVLAVPIGVISAVKQYSIMDRSAMLLTLLLTAIPPFWLGMLMMLVFSLKLGIFPATGADNILAYVLPVITVSARSLANIARMTRATMLEVMAQDYVRTVRAKGAGEFRVIMKHALRNALIPVVTVAGVDFGYLLGGAVLIETVFAMPGLGTLVVDSIRCKDIPVVMGATLVIAIFFCLVNLLVDVLYAFLDPQIKSQMT